MFDSTGEKFPKPLFFLVRYFLVAIMSISFVLGVVHEFSNPLDLPWWAFMCGWMLMLFPILLSLFALCIPKKRGLFCLHKYSNKGVAQIEYTSNDNETDENNPRQEPNKIDEGERVCDGEIELQTNFKLTKIITSEQTHAAAANN